jgi:deoxycytidylate deaminase
MNCSVRKFAEHIEVLKACAQKSDLTHKHGACLLKGTHMLSFGINRYIKEIFFRRESVKFSIHAEIDALFNADNKFVKGMDILIIRIGKSHSLRNSRPCNSCIDKLKQKGIRKAYYSNERGEIVYEFIDSMEKVHTCSGDMIRRKISYTCKTI